MNKQTPSLAEAAKLLTIEELKRIRSDFRDIRYIINRQKVALATEETELVYQGFIAPLTEYINLIDDILDEKWRIEND